ncbi:hypothetical protein [Cerasicoccus frondis]|uniref:hypothetical protein n=1 Tax=Cerasicoccus frondis TaxID=490090 RepID=UPI002852AACE|nr:hypothetical protein [Cerasicoccus frondis]
MISENLSIPSLKIDSTPQKRAIINAYLNNCRSRLLEGSDIPFSAAKSQNYHTTIPNGTMVRLTRDAMDFSLALLEEGNADSIAHASRILHTVIEAQDQEPCNPTYGIWPWFFEEPISKMRPPDWNWADFIGMRLVHVYVRYGKLLAKDLLVEIKASLTAAAQSIFRRNVGPEYTNIAVKGALVTILVGEKLEHPMLLTYGRQRLQRFIEHTLRHGGFNEYNSPPYGILLLLEVERGLFLSRDEQAKRLMLEIHEIYWSRLSEAIHLPTRQICGPHARSYNDLLTSEQTFILAEGLEAPLYFPISNKFDQQIDAINLFSPALIPRIPCPGAIRETILSTPRKHFIKQEYVRSDNPEDCRHGAIWLDGDACIGSVNIDNLWTQRHPVIGYWRTGEDVAVLRVRLKHGEQDFASGALRTVQKNGHLLSVCSLITNRGDSHDHLDKPSDGTFELDQLHLSIELSAPDVSVTQKESGAYTLSAGNHAISIHPLHCEFDAYPVEWSVACETGRVCVVATVNEGKKVHLPISSMKKVGIGFFLSLHDVCEMESIDLKSIVEENYVSHFAQSLSSDLKLTAYRHPRSQN